MYVKVLRHIFVGSVGVVLTVLFFILPILAHAEAISTFDTQFAIQKNGTVQATERISYDFGTTPEHGIFRTIPLTAPNGPQIIISNIIVTDGNGTAYPFLVSVSGGIESIKIGNPNVTVVGQKMYVITYTVENVIRGFTDHQEFYWNVTGNQWPVQIGHAEATVILPDVVMQNVHMKCFTGVMGSTETACTAQNTGRTLQFVATRPLHSGEGLSIVVGMPLGSVSAVAVLSTQTTQNMPSLGQGSVPVPGTIPAPFDPMASIFSMFSFLFSAFIVLIMGTSIGNAYMSRRRTRPVIPKELRRDPVIPFYEAPDTLSSIEVGTIYNREVDPTDISSVIVDLAVRGYLKIRRVTSKTFFWTNEDFEIIKIKDGADLVTPADIQMYALLFPGVDIIKTSELVGKRATLVQGIKNIRQDTLNRIEGEGYFNEEAYERSKIFLKRKGLLPLAVIVLYFVFVWCIGESLLVDSIFLFVLFIVTAGRHWFTIYFGRTLTPKGIQAMREILGFKLFLEVTEKDRLKMMSSPSAEPTLFEKNLPYAMVFGVEKEWAAKFEGMYVANPVWYEDPTATAFSATLFVSQLGVFGTAVSNSFAGYSGSGNYSSGFGGGGFSGGGGGGGGGGSW